MEKNKCSDACDWPTCTKEECVQKDLPHTDQSKEWKEAFRGRMENLIKMYIPDGESILIGKAQMWIEQNLLSTTPESRESEAVAFAEWIHEMGYERSQDTEYKWEAYGAFLTSAALYQMYLSTDHLTRKP